MEQVEGSAAQGLRRIWDFIWRNIAHICLFIMVNVFFGAAGVWIPAWHSGSWWDSLAEQFENAGPYTFAIAFLAACLSYVGLEYLDSRATRFRQWKMLLTLCAVALMILCVVRASSGQTVHPVETVHSQSLAAAQGTGQASNNSRVNPPQHSATEAKISPSKAAALWDKHTTQSVLVMLSVIVGFAIFLTFQALTTSMTQAVEEIEADLEADADLLISELPGNRNQRSSR